MHTVLMNHLKEFPECQILLAGLLDAAYRCGLDCGYQQVKEACRPNPPS